MIIPLNASVWPSAYVFVIGDFHSLACSSSCFAINYFNFILVELQSILMDSVSVYVCVVLNKSLLLIECSRMANAPFVERERVDSICAFIILWAGIDVV